jgi:hypothetical protein
VILVHRADKPKALAWASQFARELGRRGPDGQGIHEIESGHLVLIVVASVLHIRCVQVMVGSALSVSSSTESQGHMFVCTARCRCPVWGYSRLERGVV